MDRRALRASMGSRVQRRAHTKHHTQTLNKVGGAQRAKASELRPGTATRMRQLVARQRQLAASLAGVLA